MFSKVKKISRRQVKISISPPALGIIVLKSHLKNNEAPILAFHAKKQRRKDGFLHSLCVPT
jgi:hypothetical protein